MACNIAFLGYNEKLTRQYFKQFATDNADQVRLCDLQQGRIVLTDGTEILRVPAADPAWIKGRRFDQIIVADDWRVNALLKRWDEIDALELRCEGSIIPEEFRCLFYYIDEEAPK